MADSDSVKPSPDDPPGDQIKSAPRYPDPVWPPPVQVAAMIATALAAGLLLTGHEEAALAAILLALILQGVHLFQVKAYRDDYVRQQEEKNTRS